MESTPGMQLRSGDKPSRVLCECGKLLATLPPGTRVAFRGAKSTSRLVGQCVCGKEFDLPTVEASGGH